MIKIVEKSNKVAYTVNSITNIYRKEFVMETQKQQQNKDEQKENRFIMSTTEGVTFDDDNNDSDATLD